MKRIIFQLFAVLLVLSLLAGCGQKSEPTAATTPATTAATQATTAPVETVPEPETVTEDLSVNGFTSENTINNIILMAAPLDGGEDREFAMGDGEEVRALTEALFHYQGRFVFRVTYTGDHIDDYTILDGETGEDLGKLDAEGLYQTFDVRAKYETRELDASETGIVELSQLESGILYLVTVDPERGIEVNCDLDTNAMVYCEDSEYAMEEQQAFLTKNLEEPSRIPFSVFSNLVYLRCVSFEDAEVTEYLNEAEYIPISRCQHGEPLEILFESCIYNDTEEKAVIVDSEGTVVAELEAGSLWGFDWMGMCDYTLQ